MKNMHNTRATSSVKDNDINMRVSNASNAVTVRLESNTLQFQAIKIVKGLNNKKYHQLEKLIIIFPVISTKEKQYDEGLAIAEHILTSCQLHKNRSSIENILVQPIKHNPLWQEKNCYKKAPHARSEREIITEHTVLPDWPVGTVVIRGKTIIAVKKYFDSYIQETTNAAKTTKENKRANRQKKGDVQVNELVYGISELINPSVVIIDNFSFIESAIVEEVSESAAPGGHDDQEMPTDYEDEADKTRIPQNSTVAILTTLDDAISTEPKHKDSLSHSLTSQSTNLLSQLSESQASITKEPQYKTSLPTEITTPIIGLTAKSMPSDKSELVPIQTLNLSSLDETEVLSSDEELTQLKEEQIKKQKILAAQLAALKKEQDLTAYSIKAFLALKKRKLSELCRTTSEDLAKTEEDIQREKKYRAVLEKQLSMTT